MIGSVFSSSLAQLAKAARLLPSAASTLGSTLSSALSTEAIGKVAGSKSRLPVRLAPQTPFNTGIEAGRVFVTATVPLAECKAMGKAVGGSLNDVLLWICSTALRDYLTRHVSLPKKFVSGRRQIFKLSSAVNHRAWAGAEHHDSDLRRSCRFRHRGR